MRGTPRPPIRSWLVVLLLAACDPSIELDAAAGDAGVLVDRDVPDAPRADSDAAADAAMFDAAMFDAAVDASLDAPATDGAVTDGAVIDGGLADAALDTGSPPDDASESDASLDSDAGALDAGVDAAPDSGVAMPPPTLVFDPHPAIVLATTIGCAAGGPDCVLDLAASTDAEEGSRGTLQVSCGSSVVEYEAFVVVGRLVFAAVRLIDQRTCDLQGTVTSATRGTTTVGAGAIFVDRIAPSLVITHPLAGAVLTPADDASPGSPGFQIAVRADTVGAVSAEIWVAGHCDATFTTCDPPSLVATPSIPVDATISLPFGETERGRIEVRAQDSAGNESTARVGVTMALGTCSAAISVPFWINAAACAPAAACASVVQSVPVSLVGSACGAATELRLYDGAVEVDRGPVGTPLAFTASDGVSYALEVRALDGMGRLVASSGVRTASADLSPPLVALVPVPVGGIVTPAAGSTTLYGQAADLAPGTTGLQTHLAVRLSDANAAGGRILSATAFGSVPVVLVPTNIALPHILPGPGPDTVTQLWDVTLTDGETQRVDVTGEDAAGNRATSSYTAVVDLVSPAAVTLDSVTWERHRGAVTLRWHEVGDDGALGTAASYDVRYSSSPITAASFDTDCDAFASVGSDPRPVPAGAGATMQVRIGAPDDRAPSDPCRRTVLFGDTATAADVALYVAVRAVDDLGNSALTVHSSTVGEAALRLGSLRFDATAGAFGSAAETAGLSFGGTALGDLDGDGRDDLGLGSATARGFCVVMGRGLVDETFTTATGSHHTCLRNGALGAIAPGLTQIGHTVVRLGDVNADGLDDFAVTGRFATTDGAALVYFGQLGAIPTLTSPNLVLHGVAITGSTPTYAGVCGGGDLDGDGTMDIALGTSLNTAGGQVVVLPGRTSWTSATHQTIDLSSPAALMAEGCLTIVASTSETGFGARCAFVGDVLPTPTGLGGARSDLAVLQSGGTDPRLVVFAGRSWAPGASATLTLGASPTTEDGRGARIRQDGPSFLAGYGTYFAGGLDLTGDATADLLIAHAARSLESSDGRAISVVDGADLAGALGADLRVGTDTVARVDQSWTGPFGYVLYASLARNAVAMLGDFDGYRPSPRATNDIAWARLGGAGIEVRMSHPTLGAGRFPFTDAVWQPTTTDAALGLFVAVADMDDDGHADLLTGGSAGIVWIAY